VDNALEAEKIRGMVYLAIGDNAYTGRTLSVDLHEDFILPRPDLYLDGEIVMQGGQLVSSRFGSESLFLF
jgi:leucyl aminopeptidase (aminopeptidase T)